MLREWIDLTQREEALGLGPEVPVLLDPQGHADVRLIRFFRRSRYAALARSTREAYALDLRLFLNFLALRETVGMRHRQMISLISSSGAGVTRPIRRVSAVPAGIVRSRRCGCSTTGLPSSGSSRATRS